MVFKKYDIWDLIILQDTKQSFKIKLQNLYLRFPDESYDVNDCIRDLYP